MTLHVRAAVAEDWPTIVEFNCLLAAESEGKTLDRSVVEPGVKALLADPRKGRYFVALSEGQIVGQLMHTYEWSDWRNGDIWWLQSVYVHSEFRRQGVFRALFEHLRKLAETSPQIAGLRLYVEEHNDRALATYRKLGLEIAGYLVMEKLRGPKLS
jgi:ribosomal protein S18 acetylase RimI-like enzyme